MKIRRATIDDAPAIREVAHTTWHATYMDFYSRENIDAFLDGNYSIVSLVQEITRCQADDFRLFNVAETDGQVVGFMQMSRAKDGTPWIWRIYVLPSHQRLGIGTAMLAGLEAHLRTYGEGRYALHVQERNTLGQAFYFRHGFVHKPKLDKDDEWHMEKVLT